MTKADDVFMLNVDDTLNRDTMKKILHYGEPDHSQANDVLSS